MCACLRLFNSCRGDRHHIALIDYRIGQVEITHMYALASHSITCTVFVWAGAALQLMHHGAAGVMAPILCVRRVMFIDIVVGGPVPDLARPSRVRAHPVEIFRTRPVHTGSASKSRVLQ